MITTNLIHFLDHFPDLRVLVIGDAMLDQYLSGPSERLCREAPVPIVDVTAESATGGGAANTAINVRTLGATIHMLSVLGDDADGYRLQTILNDNEVCTKHLILHHSRKTLSKHRIVANSQLLVRFDLGTITPISTRLEARLIRSLNHLYPQVDAVIVSDYGYGILTPRIIRRLGELQARMPRLLIVDAKKPEVYRDAGVSAIKPNYGETLRLLGLKPENDRAGRVKQIHSHKKEILERTGAQIAAVTLDQSGALIFERHGPHYRTYARPNPDSRAAGAGDTFTSGLALALAAGAHAPAAAEIASAAASVVVAQEGTTACSLAELRGCLHGNNKVILESEILEDRLLALREQQKRIVFTNGCFDILHRGHISYLAQAKELGDILIVGLNSDESVRRLKGDNTSGPRPINCLEDRAQVLSAMSCVDFVVPFSEDTPRRLIELIRPDIFVKGGDYTRETLPEAPLVEELGGSVRLLPYLAEFSTTSIIERIRQQEQPPAQNGAHHRQWQPVANP